MITVLESIKLSTGYLEKKGIESPRINAELLLAHILNCNRLDLYLTFDRPLTDEEITLYRGLLKRRGNFEPLQYIVGFVEFYGLNFEVNPNVLIPRPETEILVEEIINHYEGSDEVNILDIGTGSGNVAIALAVNIKGSKITATDISKDALETAKRNSMMNKTDGNVNFIHNDILHDSLMEQTFDVIVSNPPYIALKDFDKLRPELRIFEPRQALTDNSDGLIYYKAITFKAREYLKPGGKLFFEVGEGQSEAVKKILEVNQFVSVQIRNDYLNIERVISGVLM